LNTIALDTSMETLGICLKTDGGLWSLSINRGFQHSTTLVTWIEKICLDAGIAPGALDLVIVSTGPGSFTGLRIGLATAKGLAAGAGCPFRGVPTLDALAWGYRRHTGSVVPVIDARRGRIYAAVFRSGERVSDYFDCPQPKLADHLTGLSSQSQPILLTGPCSDSVFYEAAESAPTLHLTWIEYTPDPHALLDRGCHLYQTDGESDADLAPLYLRKSEAELKMRGKP
jgi:tRNA threonylcarbamoyladenosine biosynthesis protein TsaB